MLTTKQPVNRANNQGWKQFWNDQVKVFLEINGTLPIFGAKPILTLIMVATKAPTMKTPIKVAASVKAANRCAIVVTNETLRYKQFAIASNEIP